MTAVKVREKLLALAEELELQGLLARTPPSEQALASTTPFACDVMPFEQWLQFIFLPKMHFMLDNAIPLPSAMSIAQMAEHVWADKLGYKNIILLLTELDTLVGAVS